MPLLHGITFDRPLHHALRLGDVAGTDELAIAHDRIAVADLKYLLQAVRHKDDAQALESYEKALKVDPVNASIYFRLGCYYRDRGDAGQAEKHFETSHRLNCVQDNAAGLNLYDIHNR